MHPLVEKLREHLHATQLLSQEARILVGYSGGADSTFLVHALHQLGYNITAGHLHHGMRKEADDELERCQAFCDSLGVPFAAGRADVPLLSSEGKMGLEEAGRIARYDFLQRAALRLDIDLIATAHTIDDHVETVILNMARGSGLNGIAGIPAVRGNIVRPMLHIARQETRAYCEELGLWFHDDPANTDPAFTRSRLRMTVIPELKQIQPNLFESVSRLASIAASEDEYLDRVAAAALEQCEARERNALSFLTDTNEIILNVEVLRTYPVPLLRRCIRLATRVVGAELDYSQTHIVEAGIRSSGNSSVTAEGGQVTIDWNQQTATFRQLLADSTDITKFNDQGSASQRGATWTINTQPADPKDYVRPRNSLNVIVAKDRVKGHLFCRTWKQGDSIAPLNMQGTKKVSDILNEASISLNTRKLLPLVCDDEGIIWVPGVCIADRVKITSSSESAFELTFRSLKE